MAVYTALDVSEVQDLLTGLGGGQLERFEPIAQGIENTNYRVWAGGQCYVLTVFEGNDAEGVAASLGLASALAKRGVRCPAPREGAAGSVAWVRGKPAALVPFVPGTVVWAPSEEQLEALGAAVAGLHLAGRDLEFPLPRPHEVAELVSLAEQLAGAMVARDPVLAELLRVEARYQSLLPEADLPSGIIHADLFRDNILFDLDGVCVAAFIDFQMAGYGPWLYDLAVILLDAGWGVGGVVGDRARALLRGYRAVRPVTGEEFRLLPDLLRRAALRFLCLRLERFVVSVRPMAAGDAKDPGEYAEKLRILQRSGGGGG